MHARIPVLLLASSVLVVGCEKKNDPAPPPGEAQANPTPEAPTESTVDVDAQPSPLAVPEVQPGFSGAFSGDGLDLNLAGAAGTFAGRLTLRGQVYPVTARVGTDGALAGTFESGGKPYALSATLEGNTVTLTSSNKTYTLTRQPSPAPGDALTDAAPAPLAGVYLGTIGETPASLELNEDGTNVRGLLMLGERPYALEATRGSILASGSLRGAQPDDSFHVELALTGEGLRIAIAQGEGTTARRTAATLRRSE